MAQVITWTNLDLPDLHNYMKQLVADSTGRQEMTVMSVVEKLDSLKFGVFDSGIFAEIGYVGTADTYRTQKIVQFITNKLQQKYMLSKLQVYVTFSELNRFNVCLNGTQM